MIKQILKSLSLVREVSVKFSVEISSVFSFLCFYWKMLAKQIRCIRPEAFLRKDVLKICSKFTGERPCRNAISIKLQGTLIEISLRDGWICNIFSEQLFLKTPLDCCFWQMNSQESRSFAFTTKVGHLDLHLLWL